MADPLAIVIQPLPGVAPLAPFLIFPIGNIYAQAMSQVVPMHGRDLNGR